MSLWVGDSLGYLTKRASYAELKPREFDQNPQWEWDISAQILASLPGHQLIQCGCGGLFESPVRPGLHDHSFLPRKS